MPDVTIVKRKHHSGLDADKAGIAGAIGETYGASDSGKLYYWNVSLSSWKTGLGYEFVERLVDAPDFQVGDFTCDGNWHVNGLNLQPIVPTGAVMAKVRTRVSDDAANSTFQVRRDAAHSHNAVLVKTHVANISNTKVEDVSIDSDRLLDYQTSNLVFAAIDVTVLGWYI